MSSISRDAKRWVRWWILAAVVLVLGFTVSRDFWMLVIGLIAFAPYE